jgi:hypothetical protein
MSAQIDIDQRGYPNYNLFYGQLRWANGGNPLPSACFDAGAVQTNYTAVQFLAVQLHRRRRRCGHSNGRRLSY